MDEGGGGSAEQPTPRAGKQETRWVGICKQVRSLQLECMPKCAGGEDLIRNVTGTGALKIRAKSLILLSRAPEATQGPEARRDMISGCLERSF